MSSLNLAWTCLLGFSALFALGSAECNDGELVINNFNRGAGQIVRENSVKGYNALGMMHGDDDTLMTLAVENLELVLQAETDSAGYFFSEASELCTPLTGVEDRDDLTHVEFYIRGDAGESTDGIRLSIRTGQRTRDGEPINGCDVGSPWDSQGASLSTVGLSEFDGCWQRAVFPLTLFDDLSFTNGLHSLAFELVEGTSEIRLDNIRLISSCIAGTAVASVECDAIPVVDSLSSSSSVISSSSSSSDTSSSSETTPSSSSSSSSEIGESSLAAATSNDLESNEPVASSASSNQLLSFAFMCSSILAMISSTFFF